MSVNSLNHQDINELADEIEENTFGDIHSTEIDETFEGLQEEKWPWSQWEILSTGKRPSRSGNKCPTALLAFKEGE